MKRALVIGCAEGVWAEVARAQRMSAFDTVYCVKMSGIYWRGGFFWWVTLHPEFMNGYVWRREQLGLSKDFKIIGPLIAELGGQNKDFPVDRRVSYMLPPAVGSGSSGLFGVKIAMDDGHDRIVIAGVPMVKESAHFERGNPWSQCGTFQHTWESALPQLEGRVKSLSGWTAGLLGQPTEEWLGH